MKQPLEIIFRDIPHSDFIEAKIREKAEKLDRFYDRIMACRVVVETPHGHHYKGNLYHVSIDLTVPEKEIVINRSPKNHHAHEDVYVSIRDAFDAAKRKLQNYASKRRGNVKSHQIPLHGAVSEIIEMEDFGRIKTTDGKDVYFHRNSIVDGDFNSLEIGDEVRFSEEAGENGPQATTVYLVGKHHIVQ